MASKYLELGPAMGKAKPGAEYVEKTLATVDDHTLPFQDAMIGGNWLLIRAGRQH